jgi:hypothetical protein
MSAERREGAFLVHAHQAAIAGNIGSEDSGELAFHGQPSGAADGTSDRLLG